MRAGLSNYFSATQDPANASSMPSYDRFGPDFRGYWTLDDWITWHRALVASLGAVAANQKFATAWNQQDIDSSPVMELEFNEGARQYFVAANLSTLIDPTIFGLATDFFSTGTNVSTALASSSNTFRWVLPVAGIALLYFAVQAIGKDPGGQSKKFFGGVRELY